MASGEDSNINEVIKAKEESEENGPEIEKKKKCSKLRLIGRRCKQLVGKRLPKGNKATGSNGYLVNQNPKGSKIDLIKDRERRSKLAEDALFCDDMLEVSHLQDNREPKRSDGSKVKNRISKALSIKGSPVASCVCLRYSPKDQSEFGTTLQAKSRELKKEEVLVPAAEEGEPTLRPDGTMVIHNPFHALNSVSLSSSQLRGSQLASALGAPDDDRRRSSGGILSLLPFDIANSLALGQGCQQKKLAGPVHSQVDYTNFLIPGLRDIVNCPFYWGKIDRYEAESRLWNKPEGSFLLRDSAQDEFVFSVSFRRYSRSLHARIEEDSHMFSFDSHDPGVHSSPSIRKLLEYYKDPLSCMFFEPMLLFPVVRKTCFSLQNLARATICDHTTYAGILGLPMPTVLKNYLREYHYKHKIRTRYLESIA